MEYQINFRYSDSSSSFRQNGEEFSYILEPNSLETAISKSTSLTDYTEILDYASYSARSEYFLKFRFVDNNFFLENDFEDRLIFYRRTASLTLPIAEVAYYYQYTRDISYTSYINNVESLLQSNKLVVKISTDQVPMIPKNNESLLVYSTRNLVLEYSHIAYSNFFTKKTSFYVPGQRKFDGIVTPCEECIQEEMLKNYNIIKSLPK